MFVLIGGKPGSGFEDLAASVVDELDKLEIAVESVKDEAFHLAVTTCELCASNGKGGQPCRDCPESLEASSLFQNCEDCL